MPKAKTDHRLDPRQVARAIRELAKADGKVRCRAALRLCHAAYAGTDISSAIPALAKAAEEEYSSNLAAMWAVHALEAAAVMGVDIGIALPALLDKLGYSVDQYVARALRAWASRSTTVAIRVRDEVRAIVGPRPISQARVLMETLEFLATRAVPDAELTWQDDRKRGVCARAGRLLWLTSHGWDHEQSFPDYAQNGVPAAGLCYSTGSWVVPRKIQDTVRGWLGLAPEEVTHEERERQRLADLFARLEACTFSTRANECMLCAAIGERQSGSPMEGHAFTPEVDRLKSVAGLAGSAGIRRCPECGTFYEYDYHHDCEPFEPESDWHSIARIPFEKVRDLVTEYTFGKIHA